MNRTFTLLAIFALIGFMSCSQNRVYSDIVDRPRVRGEVPVRAFPVGPPSRLLRFERVANYRLYLWKCLWLRQH